MRPIALVLAATLVACRYAPTPIPLAGAPSDLVHLAGEWVGEYHGDDSGRLGTITFSLRAGTDTAYGDVFMMSRDDWSMLSPADARQDHLRHVRSEQALAVRFVSVRGGTLSGTLEPYIAPDCDCVVTTTFTGRLTGDSVSGTYVTRNAVGWEQRGRWKAERRR